MPLTPVLIVGAGPAGLAAALDLTMRGVGVVIIDESAGAMEASRAKGLQPRTLEILETLGVVDEVLAGGGPFPRWRSYSAGQVAWEKSIYDLLGTGEPTADPAVPFPQTWMVPQWRTEQILRDALAARGVHVESRSSLVALDIAGAEVSATVAGPAGRRRIDATYVIAADGAASAVRKLLGVTFAGVTRDDDRHVIADVRTADLDRVYWHNWSDPANAAARVSICPLPGTDVFQFVAPLLAGTPTPPTTLATIQRLFDARSDGVAATFTEAPWITVTRANERLASAFRVGPVFLVGDAAHTVPAAGGQGMNTAIQDSHNLCWKLATVLDSGPDRLLDTYDEERRPIAARLMAGFETPDDSGEKADVFQLRNNYRGRSLSEESRMRSGTVQAGDRAPDAPLAPPVRLFEYFDGGSTCIAFGDGAADACRSATVRVLDVRRESPTTAQVVQDIYDVRADESVVFLVRPDGHVGLVADHDIEDRLSAYLPRITARR